MIVRIFGMQGTEAMKSARSSGFIAKYTFLAQNPHLRKDFA
jgi:hypothetical protein